VLVKVLWPFLDGRIIAEPGQLIEVNEQRARALGPKLVTPIEALQPPPDWFPDWRGATCIIVGSGPSAADAPLAPGSHRCIAINNSWRLVPWADALYATDYAWWEREAGVPEFGGLKISQDCRLKDRPAWGIRTVTVWTSQDQLLITTPGEIGWGGNSGFAAINLAVQFGAKRIVLVGFDMRIDRGMHWHGKHGPGLNNPSQDSVRRWRRVIDEQAPILAALGVEMVNASPISALTAYPKMDLREALAANG
jgi:hypothetical protein